MKNDYRLQQILTYKDCYLLISNRGVDLVDKDTGKFTCFQTLRVAKWHATIWTRLKKEFAASNVIQISLIAATQATA